MPNGQGYEYTLQIQTLNFNSSSAMIRMGLYCVL